MAKNINSAYRIKEILNDVSSKSNKMPIHEVWAEIFNIEERDQQKKNFSIVRCLADIHDEVEFVRSEMLKLGYSSELYSSSLTKCNEIFSAQVLMGQWLQLKQQITPEIPIALGFCSEILPNEEAIIEKDSLDALKKMASELRRSLANSKLPPYTIIILEKHLVKIEQALSIYRAIGSKAFEDVMQSAYGEIITSGAVINESKGSEEFRLLFKVWQKTKIVLDGVVDTNKRLGAMQGIAEKGQQLLEILKDFNSP